MALKLGKKPFTPDSRDLKLSTYADAATILPKVPATFGHEKGLTFGMLGNGPDDTVEPGFEGCGDCVWAGGDHETQIWLNENGTANARTYFSGKTAVSDYSKVTGYVIDDDNSDVGTDVRTALKYRQKTGLVDTKGNRHKIGAYLALEPGNTNDILIAMYLFGAVGIGINFPDSAMDQFNENKPWSVVAGANIDGGHYIPLVARRDTTYWECVSWAKVQKMTHGFFSEYCDEAWAILSPESIKTATGKTAEGFNLAQLQADLKAI